MRPEPRTFVLGTLRIRGPAIRFEPAGPLVDMPRGEPVELLLRYFYEEASGEREDCRIALRVSLEGREEPPAQVELRDTPVAKDAVEGHVSVPAAFPRPGEVRGSFAVDVERTAQPWAGGTPEVTRFREAGAFTVRVR